MVASSVSQPARAADQGRPVIQTEYCGDQRPISSATLTRPIHLPSREWTETAYDGQPTAYRAPYFEPLKVRSAGLHSIRVNDRYRVIFQFENGDVFEVRIENFHGRKQS